MAAITSYAELTTLMLGGGALGDLYAAYHGNYYLQVGTPQSLFSRTQWADSSYHVRTTAEVCNASSPAALLRNPKLPGSSSKQLWLADVEYQLGFGAGAAARSTATLYDRLCHQGGLSGAVSTTQTTNLPTAALTRYTDGVGVIPCLEINDSIGTTSVTATITYTNQAGVAGRVSYPLVITSNFAFADAILFFSLQDGDTGCRSIEAFTLSGTTGTVGNIGLVLVKRIAMMPTDHGMTGERQPYRNLFFGGAMVEIHPDACLMLIAIASGGSNTATIAAVGRLGIAAK